MNSLAFQVLTSVTVTSEAVWTTSVIRRLDTVLAGKVL